MNSSPSVKNKTITLTPEELKEYSQRLLFQDQIETRISRQPGTCREYLTCDTHIRCRTICADIFQILSKLPRSFADFVFLDPPYNLTKNFNGFSFIQSNDESYLEYVRSWFSLILPLLKPDASLYLCGDWKSSSTLYRVLMENGLQVRNRITWQREKGRGAKENWKNACEDIWFATLSNNYYFNLEAVKQKRRVIAPYTQNGQPKDWEKTQEGNFRLTHPGNFWDDISVPYWSMAENTPHPTQKPEKLLAKLILASCPPDGMVFDPFLGSGTASVTAKKLGRFFCGIEQNLEYACVAEKRLEKADRDKTIQGYSQGVFWERNTAALQKKEV